MGRLLLVVGWSRHCRLRLWRPAGAVALKYGAPGRKPLQRACRPGLRNRRTSRPGTGPTFFPSGSEAARLMAEIDAGALPVGEDDRLVGMITDRDT